MKADIYNKEGKKLTTKVELNSKVFSIKPNQHSIYLAVKSELASNRQGTSSSKTRSEVRGGGRKPYKQKGTGNARVGSIRNPSRVHGGTTFGPNVHGYSKKVNKKVKNLARKSVLSSKLSSGSLFVIEDLQIDTSKTKSFISILNGFDILNQKVTFFADSLEDNLYYSSRNVKNVSVIPISTASTFDLLDNKIVIIDRNSVEFLNKQLGE